MTCRAHSFSLTRSASTDPGFWWALYLAVAFAIFGGSSLQAQAVPSVGTNQATTKSCAIPALDFDGTSDVQGIQAYKQAMIALLEHSEFDQLDCIADSARTNKDRLPGGLWKVHNIYPALEQPHGHATEDDWNARLSLLKQWVAAKPDSITARVALAGAYEEYAWYARGSGASDTAVGHFSMSG